MSFYTRVKEKEEGLTPTDVKIAEYVLKNPDRALSESSSEIGKGSGTSASAVIRFIKRLQYDSLNEFKYDLALDINEGTKKMPELIVEEADTAKSISIKVATTIDVVVKDTIELMNFRLMTEAVRKIRKADNVFLFGVGASAMVANDLYTKLIRIGRRCFFDMDSSIQLSSAVHATRNDVAIAFSYSGKTIPVINALRKAGENGAYCISVTSNHTSSLAQMSDAMFQVPSIEKDIRIGAIGSRYSMLLITDIIYLSVAQENYEKVEKFLLETKEMVYPLREE